MIYKAHHSLCDGVSAMNYHMGQGDTFNNDALIPIRKVTCAQKFLLRASFLLYIPKLFVKFMTIKQDCNVLHDGKRHLSGRKISSTSGDILFKDVKEAAKSKGVTINDFITSCAATGIK